MQVRCCLIGLRSLIYGVGTELSPLHRISYYWNYHTGDAVWLRSKKKQIFPYPFSIPPTSPRHAPLHRRAKNLEDHPSKKKRNAYLPAIGDLRSIHIRDVTDDDDTHHPASPTPYPASPTLRPRFHIDSGSARGGHWRPQIYPYPRCDRR